MSWREKALLCDEDRMVDAHSNVSMHIRSSKGVFLYMAKLKNVLSTKFILEITCLSIIGIHIGGSRDYFDWNQNISQNKKKYQMKINIETWDKEIQ